MPIKTFLRGYVLASVVFMIGVLLLVNILLIYENSTIIEENKRIQDDAERIKVQVVEIPRNLHLIDMIVRSYALIKKDRFLSAFDSAEVERGRIFSRLERDLRDQQFPMGPFFALRDSMIGYYQVVDSMKHMLQRGEQKQFLQLLDIDPGYKIWLHQNAFRIQVDEFENRILKRAKERYERALRDSYLLQILLFFLTMPTLAYSAYYASQALRTSEKLRRAEELNNDILSRQNARLEALVKERTYEILTQNEEITSQNEEITAHNEQLVAQQWEIARHQTTLTQQNEQLRAAKKVIEDQHQLIQQKNQELVVEVKKQTQDLKTTNLELIEQNNRLEQFAYIISHNLRAPMARIIGLAGIFELAKTPDEAKELLKLIVNSASDLDHVIRDLAKILEMQKLNTQLLVATNFADVIEKTKLTLKREIDETMTRLSVSIENDGIVHTIPAYLESILYNLVSNAIKYRKPSVPPEIKIRVSDDEGFIRVEVSDNGLGIDLPRYRDKLFSLYKRFHFHVEGKGLGLYLVKTQVSALGGKITVQSEEGEGTTFTMFFKK